MLPEEVAVAIAFNGSTQAVMMATPADLTDFAYGFALTEGLAAPSEITEVTPVETPKGIDLQIWVTEQAEARLGARRRKMAGPVGCGLCGIDSIEEATRTERSDVASSLLNEEEAIAVFDRAWSRIGDAAPRDARPD